MNSFAGSRATRLWNANFCVAARSGTIEAFHDSPKVLFDAEPTRRANNEDRNPAPGLILLVFEVLVGRDQHIEADGVCLRKESAVHQRAPVKLQSNAHVMFR